MLSSLRKADGFALAGIGCYVIALICFILAGTYLLPVVGEAACVLFLCGLALGIVARISLMRSGQKVARWDLIFWCLYASPLLSCCCLGFVLPSCQLIQDAKLFEATNQQLVQLAEAMHAYQNQHKSLPAWASFDEDKNPLLSWRVLILPQLGEEEIFNEFHHNEPWDSPHNLQLLERMPEVYKPHWRKVQPGLGMTYFQVFVGPGAAFEGERGTRYPEDFPDGGANTILIVEAASAVPWTQPQDLPFARGQPLPELTVGIRTHGSTPTRKEKLFFVLADTTTRSIRLPYQGHLLPALITRNGGEKINPHW
jgi:hypothetical protein